MSHQPPYTEFHPRWYRTRTSTYWWLGSWSYFGFILRELSSAFIGWFILFTLLQISAINQGSDAYRDFVAWSRHPVVLGLNVVTLFFVLFHAATWLNLAPKAMVVRMGGQRVPPWVIIASNYAAWAAISAILAWLIL